MKKILLLTIFAVFALNASFATPGGMLFSDVTETVALGDSDLSYTMEASGANMSVLGLIGLGNASAQTIASEAGIKKISRIDKKSSNILFFIYSETFTVYGK